MGAGSRVLCAVVAALALLSPRARAGSGEISFHAGKMSLSLGKSASGGGPATVSGSAYGVRFLHSAGPVAAVGLDVDFMKPADSTSSKLIADAHASTAIDSESFLAVVRLGATEDALQPNFLFGLGVHVTSLKLEAQPDPGHGWADTLTGEKRTLIDSEALGPALKIQGGADYAFTDNLLAGAFLAFNYLGSARYEATGQAKSLGVNSISGSMTALTGGVSVTARF